MTNTRTSIAKEPLLHFLIAGAALFGAFAWLERHREAESPRDAAAVRITARDLKWLEEGWTRQWQRPPTADELKGLVADHLREELLVREARALGLDESDTVVRRRLAQKMTFLLEDTAAIAEPTEEDLRAIHDASLERYRKPARVSFAHVFFNADRRGPGAASDAEAALARLTGPGSPDPGTLGDPSLLEPEFTDIEEQTVAGLFGWKFARALFAPRPGSAPGTWHGPIESGYGLHLVRIGRVLEARQSSFDAAREDVLEEWRRRRQKELDGRYLAKLLEKYELIVDESVKPFLASAPGDAGPSGTEP